MVIFNSNVSHYQRVISNISTQFDVQRGVQKNHCFNSRTDFTETRALIDQFSQLPWTHDAVAATPQGSQQIREAISQSSTHAVWRRRNIGLGDSAMERAKKPSGNLMVI